MIDYTDPAFYYFDSGINPIPANNDKSPKLPSGHTYFYNPIENIAELFKGAYQIGVAAGKVSDGIECIDFDAHNGEPIAEIFNSFTDEPYVKELINTGFMTVIRTIKGYHCIIKSDNCGPSQVLSKWDTASVMIETRGNGSYFVTIPSPGYSLLKGVELIKLEKIDKETRDYLIDLCRTFSIVEMAPRAEKTGRKWPESWSNDNIFGYFNNNGAKYVKKCLTDAGWVHVKDRDYDNNTVEYWRRPGKHKGISATFGMKFNMFYCFTSSVDGLEYQKAYSPVDIVMIMKFDNNMEKFRAWLNEKMKVKIPEPKIDVKPESFPTDIFPANIKDYIDMLNKANNYNKDFLSISIMFVFATLTGNKIKLRVKNDWIAPAIFWAIAVGEPGTMKTHPLNSIVRPLKEIDKESKGNFDQEMDEWITMNDDKKKDKDPKPFFRQLLVNDYTLEALHEIHTYNKNGLGMYRDEIVGFLNDMNKYRKGSDEQFWLESFNNSSYTINRVSKSPMLIDNININIIGSIQPEILENVVRERGQNGLIDRFLFTVAETEIKPITMNDIEQTWLDWWRDDVVKNMYKSMLIQDNVIINMSDDARLEFQKIDEYLVVIQNSDEETSNMKNYISKMKTYIPRFALLCFIMDSGSGDKGNVVTDVHMKKARKISDYFINSARYIFGETNKRREIKEVATRANGKSNLEKIILLAEKGYKQKDIAKQVDVSTAYVSKVLKEIKLDKKLT